MVLDIQALHYKFEEGTKEAKEHAKEGTSEGYPQALGEDKEETLACTIFFLFLFSSAAVLICGHALGRIKHAEWSTSKASMHSNRHNM